MEDHIINLHASGLYSRMLNGQNEEEVKKWRAERKK